MCSKGPKGIKGAGADRASQRGVSLEGGGAPAGGGGMDQRAAERGATFFDTEIRRQERI